MNLPMPRFRASLVFAVLFLSACDHHKAVNQAESEAGSAAVAQDDSELTGLPPQPAGSSAKPVYPRATLVALPSPAPTPAANPPADTVSTASLPMLPEDKPAPPPSMPDNPPPDASSTAATASPPPAPEQAPSSAPPPAPANDSATPPMPGNAASPVVANNPPPEMDDAESQKQVVVLDTSLGRIVIELDDVAAPRTCGNFRKLVSDGFYNHTIFHRVIPNFIIQGGDPNTKSEDRTTYGQGGPGYTLPPEIKLAHDRGAVAMARLPDSVNPQRESNGSQFYICVEPCPSLDNNYTVFAHVIKGMDVVDKIANQTRDSSDDPLSRIEMEVSMVSKGNALEDAP
jgi:cyclophilin family peptidyl-prolyl cis-trans isomerase